MFALCTRNGKRENCSDWGIATRQHHLTIKFPALAFIPPLPLKIVLIIFTSFDLIESDEHRRHPQSTDGPKEGRKESIGRGRRTSDGWEIATYN